MKIFKNLNNGSIFLEVIMAITIVGLLLPVLFTQQTTMFKNIINGHFKIARIFYLKNFLLDEANVKKAQKEKRVIESNLSDPQMKMQYELKKPNDNSTLSKNFKDVSLIKVKGTWQGLNREQEESFVGLVYIKPEKQEK